MNRTGHEGDIERTETAFASFEQSLQETLVHLHDPSYHPSHSIVAGLGLDSAQPVERIGQIVRRAIQELMPTADVPKTARSWRMYHLLSWRYVQELTQKETALRLGITVRHLRREQGAAVHLLAERLWNRADTGAVTEHGETVLVEPEIDAIDAADEPDAWRDQVRVELNALQRSTPDAVADIDEVAQGVLELASALTTGVQIQLELRLDRPRLAAHIHPTVLRQLLITAVEKLVHHLHSPGRVRLTADQAGDRIVLTLTGQPAADFELPESEFIQEIAGFQEGVLSVSRAEDAIRLQFDLPAVEQIHLLVVEDNADLVHFYRRYTAGTRYTIEHVSEGEAIFAHLQATSPERIPDVILLDVMLPDVDGWELLLALRQHPVAKDIPIIVCSVVRRDELARTLGAALHLTKPVRRQEFLAALDQVTNEGRRRLPSTQ